MVFLKNKPVNDTMDIFLTDLYNRDTLIGPITSASFIVCVQVKDPNTKFTIEYLNKLFPGKILTKVDTLCLIHSGNVLVTGSQSDQSAYRSEIGGDIRIGYSGRINKISVETTGGISYYRM